MMIDLRAKFKESTYMILEEEKRKKKKNAHNATDPKTFYRTRLLTGSPELWQTMEDK